MNEDLFIYRIDNRDIIVSVSHNWESFARANGWDSEPQCCINNMTKDN
jgi:hypothetical protein